MRWKLSKEQADWFKKTMVGVCVGVTLFLVSDFVISRRALAETNIRQDSEIEALRRDVTRMETALCELRQLSVAILTEVRK